MSEFCVFLQASIYKAEIIQQNEKGTDLSEDREAVQGAGDEVQVDPDVLQSLVCQHFYPLHIVDDLL